MAFSKIVFAGIFSVSLTLTSAQSATGEVTAQDVAEVLAQNRSLQQQVQKQQQQIDELRQRLDEMQSKSPGRTPEHTEIEPPIRLESPGLRAAREIRVSGEVGLAFFSSGREGAFPNSEFRIDDAKLFLEAPVWKNVYFFTGLELATREENDNDVYIGELYADMEDVLVAGRDQRLSLRVGRFNIPFGEEYQARSVMMNPLISHSVADIWGIDEGMQIYGSLGPVQYNLAVQNGGSATRHDFNKDKSVTARLSFEPLKSLHLSVSGHRTGKLDVAKDDSSEIWFGGEYLGPLGAAATTRTFQASLFEFDAQWRWQEGHINATAGAMRINDDQPAANDVRRANFFSVEVVQRFTPKFYGATRFGEIHIPDGYPLVGLGNYGKFYYGSPPTVSLRRLSVALGYRFADPFVAKLEYSWEQGHLINGVERNNEDMFATEIGLKF